MTQEDKQRYVTMLSNAIGMQWHAIEEAEPRLLTYLRGLVDEPQYHNAYEVLGAIKFLRLLRTYETDIDTFHDVIFKYEGIWEQRDSIWHHVEGGLKHPGTSGPRYYRLQPFQVFVLASMFLFKVWINTEEQAGSRELLPTEKIFDNGDKR